MKRNIPLLIVLIALISAETIQASKDEIKSLLTPKEVKRIESAEKLISKGDAIIESTQSLQKEIDALQNAGGRIKSGKINKRSKKIAQKKVQASLYYQDGYKKYISVLDDRLKDFAKSGNSEARQTRDDSKNLERKAKKQYNKAENLSSEEKMVELIDLAQENQKKAIEIQSKCLINLIDSQEEAPLLAEVQEAVEDTTMVRPEVAEEPLEEALVVQTDSIATTSTINNTLAETIVPESNNIAPAVAAGAVIATPMVMNTDSIAQEEPLVAKVEEPQVTEEVITPPVVADPDVFLTIQFMADKKKATQEQISNVYSGNKEVIEMNVNDWFKYSVGKYQTLDKAKADMQAENIKGFIVAYNKNERISVKEAVTILNGES
ncbi:MAG: hypothetical protein N4A71_07905 [Carboxylicivirga sp.]|jgi:hypothetical protein|nr:hypothetical protein [Carboxylicivirga sp.]